MEKRHWLNVVNTCAICTGIFATVTAADDHCKPHWSNDVGQPGTNATIRALTVFDDGSGPALYAGGYFTTAGDTPADKVARWDGKQWSALDAGPSLTAVQALTGFDDGSGPALYVGSGLWSPYIRRWDGKAWSTLGGGTNGSVFAIRGFDDGTGPALYAGGLFTWAGGVYSPAIAKWDGQQWSALELGMSHPYGNQRVFDIVVFDDGTGPALYAGGIFTAAGTTWANNVARWDGQQWSALGGGVDGTVLAMAVFDDGTGPALYVAGSFGFAGSALANHIAKWDGMEWSDLNGGIGGPGSHLGIHIYALAVYDDGTGPALYAAGSFSSAGGVPVNQIARWDGENWSALDSGVSSWIWGALAVFDDGSGTGPMLYAGSTFTSAGGMPANYIAAWGGCSPSCAGSADLNCDGTVGVADLLILLANWGPCDDAENCPADLDGDGNVGVTDLLILLANWGI